MKFVAGSHLKGHLTYRRSSAEEDNVLDQTVENAEQYGTVVYNELKAGEAYYVETRVIAVDDKRLRLFHNLRRARDNAVALTSRSGKAANACRNADRPRA